MLNTQLIDKTDTIKWIIGRYVHKIYPVGKARLKNNSSDKILVYDFLIDADNGLGTIEPAIKELKDLEILNIKECISRTEHTIRYQLEDDRKELIIHEPIVREQWGLAYFLLTGPESYVNKCLDLLNNKGYKLEHDILISQEKNIPFLKDNNIPYKINKGIGCWTVIPEIKEEEYVFALMDTEYIPPTMRK